MADSILPRNPRLLHGLTILLLALLAMSTVPAAAADPIEQIGNTFGTQIHYSIGTDGGSIVVQQTDNPLPVGPQDLPPIFPSPLKGGLSVCTPAVISQQACVTFEPCEGTNRHGFQVDPQPLVLYVEVYGPYAGFVDGGC
jgi:hypothetical protein